MTTSQLRPPMNKILVSACFIGQKVRYDGSSQMLDHPVFQQWQQENRLCSICPEVAGGLSIPRAPAEINSQNQRVINNQGIDVSNAFTSGAQQALTLCQQQNIKFALLKESSPSCGSSTIYDGTFSKRKISGMGITAKLLTAHGIEVFSEKNFEQLVKAVQAYQNPNS